MYFKRPTCGPHILDTDIQLQHLSQILQLTTSKEIYLLKMNVPFFLCHLAGSLAPWHSEWEALSKKWSKGENSCMPTSWKRKCCTVLFYGRPEVCCTTLPSQYNHRRQHKSGHFPPRKLTSTSLWSHNKRWHPQAPWPGLHCKWKIQVHIMLHFVKEVAYCGPS